MKKKSIGLLLGIVVLLLGAFLLLEDSAEAFIMWWLCITIIGAGFFRFTAKIFSAFYDKGWIFSKSLGLVITGYLVFVLSRFGILQFKASYIWTIIFIFICVIILLFRKNTETVSVEVSIDLIIFEEIVFLFFFLLWSYLTGFLPEAVSTEKFMDYGFMAAMDRSLNLPAIDMWYAGETMNYYWGGQFYAVVLCKLSGSGVLEGYNLAKALIGAFAFAMPFSIGYQLYNYKKEKQSFIKGSIAGLFSGAAVSLAGNMHYVLYGLFGNVFKLSGYESYWFPASTRYIGHNPETTDSCIHEFPSYSLVLGDLHAHVINVMFVLLFLALVFAWFTKKECLRFETTVKELTVKELIKEIFKDPYVYLFAFLAGVFKWTNFWDFVIYLTVAIIASGLLAIRQNKFGVSETILMFSSRILIFVIGSTIISFPFTSTFKTMISGIAVAKNHSALYQLAILWGLPVVCVLLLLAYVIFYTARRDTDIEFEGKRNPIKLFVSGMTLTDMFALLVGICGIGLILIPELVYVRDIYENGYARSNTMFKLTYQAYMMFGISAVYSIMRMYTSFKHKMLKIVPCILTILILLTCGYLPYAVKCWFGNVLDHDNYKGLDATAYLTEKMPEDAACVYWLRDNIKGMPVVLETNGDSYTLNCRVSAMTGLPTVMGWYTHEWLWRNDLDDLNQRIFDVSQIYTSDSREYIMSLIKKYDVEYIFVGSKEREAYENINEDMLRSLGDVCISSDYYENPAYVIRVNRG